MRLRYSRIQVHLDPLVCKVLDCGKTRFLKNMSQLYSADAMRDDVEECSIMHGKKSTVLCRLAARSSVSPGSCVEFPDLTKDDNAETYQVLRRGLMH